MAILHSQTRRHYDNIQLVYLWPKLLHESWRRHDFVFVKGNTD